MNEEIYGWNQERIMAIVRLVLPLLCGALTAFGIEVDADGLIVVAGTVVTAALSVWSWWKNNNITKNAQKSQEYLNELNAADKLEEENEKTEEAE